MRIPKTAPRHFANSDELCKFVASYTDTVILGFSTGKDSIATWLQCRRYFARVVPFYLYYVPGIRFVERSLAYYERYFETKIHRYPHGVFGHSIVDGLAFQPPERVKLFQDATIHRNLEGADVIDDLRGQIGDRDCILAHGTKLNDSLRRALVIKTHGTLYPHRKRFFPIYDWGNDRMEREIRDAGVELPVDYKYWSRSWEGARIEQMKTMREVFPEDFETLMRWVPLAQAEFWRRKFYEEEKLAAPHNPE